MKRILALLLVVFMMLSSVTFIAGATTPENVNTGAQIIPVSDCNQADQTLANVGSDSVSGDGWFGNRYIEGGTLVAGAGYMENGAYGVSVNGIPQYQGNGMIVNMAYHTF